MVEVRRSLLMAGFILLAALLALPVSAQSTQYVGIYFDDDNDPATGCDAQGFSGAEVRLTATLSVVNAPPSAQVTALEVEECVDPGTDSFGPPTPVSGNGTPPWPVGVGLGVDGSDVIEAYVSRTVFPDAAALIRAGVVSGQGEPPADTMYVTLGGGSEPILVALAQVIPIPTLSQWMLLALALLLAASALLVLRRRPARMAFMVLFLALALSAGGAGVAWAACVMDGMVGDWGGDSPLAQDPTADASGQNPDLRAFFARDDGTVVCLRIDAFVAFNGAPVANDDGYATDEDSPLNLAAPGVLGNDSDPDSDPLTVTGFDGTSTQGAAVSVNADGSFSYDPTGAAALQALSAADTVDDTFTYTIGDGNGASDSATVTVAVSGVNDPPTAMADSYETDEDTDLVISAPGVLVNDSDVDTGDTLTAVLDTDVSDGTLTLNPDGSFTYDPDLNFNGADSFTYHANDGTADSATVTVTITVGPVNDGPNAVGDNFATDEDTALNIAAPGVLTNDTDPEMDSLSVVSHDATSAQGAAVTVNADGSFTYDPTGSAALQALAGGATVDDTFTYTIEDPSGIDPDTATVTVEVTGVDDPPTAVDDTATVTEDDPATTIDVQGNDTDPDGGSNTITMVTQPDNGTVVITNAGADLTYEPDPDYCNDGSPTDDFTYTVSPGGDAATVAVSVTCVNDPPVADDEVVSATCNILGVVEAAPGETADAGAAKVFRTVTDNVLLGDSDPVEGTAVNIVQASGLPGGTTDSTAPFDITTNEGGSLTLYADGSFLYTPEGGDRSVADSFTYTIQDAGGLQDMATVTLNVGSTCIWFVDNSVSASDDVGTGTSSDPFTSLVDEIGPDALADDAEDASIAGDVIYVFEGDSQSGDSYLGGFVAEAGERLLGEGVDLVVDLGSGPETLFTGNPANRPLVDNQVAGGDAVQVTDVTGVEVAGLELDAAGNALQVTSAAAPAGIDFHDNEIAGSGSEAILISQTVNNVSDVRLANNTVSATGNGIDASLTAGSLALVIDGNTGIASDGIGIDLDGTGGDLYVTSFCGNTVSGDTVGIGIRADGVVFDAAPPPGGDADFTGDEVGCATATSVGSGANPVGGSALVLNNVSGDLAFGDLDLFAGGVDAAGLAVTGTGLLNAAAGTGFEITSTSGTVSAADGPAVDIDPTTVGLVLDSVSSTGSTTFGISLVDVAGSFQVNGATSVSSAGGDGISVADSSVALTFIGALTVSNTGGEGVDLDDLTGDFSAPVGSSLTGTTGDAFRSFSGEGNISYGGTITNTSANSVEVRDHGGGAATAVTFSGAITDSGAGIFLDNNDQNAGSTVNFTGALSLTTGASDAFTATEGGVVNVTDPSNNNLASTTTGTGVRMVNTDVGASGVKFTTVNVGDANPAAPNAGHGIILTQAGAGAFTVTGGEIQNVSDRGLDVSGGTGVINVGANISTTATGRSVEVTTHTVGDVTVSGDVDDNGLGVRLANNTTSDISFTGDLEIDTVGANTGFDAQNTQSVVVTGGTTTVDTSAGTGIAVNIVSTTIESGGVTWDSVSADGADAGIVLSSTGSTGDFEVTGEGESSTADTTAGRTTAKQGGGTLTLGSGGTITNTTDGVRLTSATDVFLRNMVIGESTATSGDAVSATTDITDNGIEVSSVSNLVLDNVLLSQTGDHGIEGSGANVGLTLIHTEILNAGDNGAGPTDGDDAMDFNTGAGAPLTGTVTIQSSILAGMSDTGLEVENFSGDLDLTVTDSFVGNNDHSDGNCNPCEGDGFLLRADGGSATIDMVVQGTTFNDIANDGIDMGNDGASNVSTLIAENIVGSNNDGADNLIDTANTEGDLEVRITDLNSDSTHRGTVLFFKADGAASTDVTINTSGASPNLIQGSTIGAGVQMFVDGDPGTGVLANGDARLLIENTDISNHFSEGVSLIVQDMSSAAGTLDATLDDVTTQKPSRGDDVIVGSLDFVAGGGGDGTLQFELVNSSIGEGSDFFGSATEGLVLRGDRQIDVVCVDDGNGGNGTPCTNIGNLTSDDNLVASVMNENGNQVAGGSFAAADVFTSVALRSSTGEVLIADPSVVTDPTLP